MASVYRQIQQVVEQGSKDAIPRTLPKNQRLSHSTGRSHLAIPFSEKTARHVTFLQHPLFRT
jgi:hypothetical protein